mgnify:CR=1 FL=1
MTANPNNRLLALDVMRGITIAGMIMVNNPGSWKYVYAPLQHAQWNGLTPTDLVFPLFMFIMGISLHISFRKYDKGLNVQIVGKIVKRTLAIFAVGIALEIFSKLCTGAFSLEGLRIMGVMQRLALAYFGAALIVQLAKEKYYLWIVGGILVAYIAILQLFNGYVHSSENIIAIIDAKILGVGHMIEETSADGSPFPFEPLGLLSTLPAVAHVLLGVFAGTLITSVKDNNKRIEQLFILGSILLFGGYLLQYLDPINKKLWTSSYTIITCGMGALFQAILIWIIDIKNKKEWCKPFEAFGVNPLFMYVLGWVFAVLLGTITLTIGEKTASVKWFLYNNVMQPTLGEYFGSLIYALLFISFVWVFGYALYKKKIYIKL